jgi:hypothetical protein
LAIGMKPKWVLSDDERHQKYGNRRKNKLKPEDAAAAVAGQQPGQQQLTDASPSTLTVASQGRRDSLEHSPMSVGRAGGSGSVTMVNNNQNDYSASTPQSSRRAADESASMHIKSEHSSNNQTNAWNSDDEESSDGSSPHCEQPPDVPTHTAADIKRLGVDGINTNVMVTRNSRHGGPTAVSRRSTNYLELNAYEKDLIDRLSIAFYHSRSYNAIDLNIQKKLAMLFQTANPSSLKKMSKVILANFIVQPVKRVITFAKLIPDFLKLELNDQMCLLQGGSMEIFICSSSSLYDQMSNKLSNIVSKDRNLQGSDSSNIQLDILRLIWSEDVFEKTIGFLKSMSELKTDEATLILFLPLILFSPDRRNLQQRSIVSNIQAKYCLLLKKYMLWKYGHTAETLRLYEKLLLKLVELRTLHEMHSSILLDADPSQLDPFPLAVLLNDKEAAKPQPLTTSSGDAEPPAAATTNNQSGNDSRRSSDVANNATVTSHSGVPSVSANGPKSVGFEGGHLNILTPASFSSSCGQISSLSSEPSPLSMLSQMPSPNNETYMITEATHKMDLVE